MSYNSHSSWFKLGHYPFNRHGITVGRLLDGTNKMRVCTLIDTCASKPRVNKNFYRKTPFLQHSYPIYKINTKPIEIANNNIINVSECVKIVISFSGNYFEIIAFLVDMTDDFDFVMGAKSMYELEADPRFSRLKFQFAERSIDLVPVQDYMAKPNQEAQVKFRMVKSPPDFHNGSVILKLITSRKDNLPQTLLVNMINRKVTLNLYNKTDEPIHLYKNSKVGCVDMRSEGYFFKSRSDIEDTILDRTLLLTAEQTTEYFTKCVENIKLVGRQTNTENPKHDKDTYSNGEDPYPWLDS